MEVIEILGQTLEDFDGLANFCALILIIMIPYEDDHSIPTFGFGDVYTRLLLFFYLFINSFAGCTHGSTFTLLFS